jgi:hypothetical protein
VSTLTFPVIAGSTEERPVKPSLLARLGAAIAESRSRKAQRVINERMAYFAPTLLEAAGLKHLSLANDDALPLK